MHCKTKTISIKMENIADFKTVENLRKVMGTLPSETPTKRTKILSLISSVDVTIEDHSKNPYKAMFVTSTSTWGNNEFEQKWDKTSLEGKLEVIKAVLTHNTLPQAKEMVQFVIRVKGVPRWLFDYHTQTVQFISFMSIGCRDNNKIDADIVKDEYCESDNYVFNKLKDLYEKSLDSDGGSWQTARAFLPQSYSHSYHFGQNLLSMVSTRGFHASKFFNQIDYKEMLLHYLYKKIVREIEKIFPLIGLYLKMMLAENENEVNEIKNLITNLKVSNLSQKDLEFFKEK